MEALVLGVLEPTASSSLGTGSWISCPCHIWLCLLSWPIPDFASHVTCFMSRLWEVGPVIILVLE